MALIKYIDMIAKIPELIYNVIIDIKRQWFRLFVFFCIFILLALIIYHFIPVRSHWHEIYRPAALELFSLKSPYSINNFYNPPWALIPIIPFALLPEKLGNAFWATCTLLGFMYVGKRLTSSVWLTFLFILLPHTLYNVIQVNVDWLVALGFLLPPRWGLFLVFLKPQVGCFYALYWLFEGWHKGKTKEVLLIFTPVTITFILSFLIFGVYFTKSQFMLGYSDKSFWPASIPIGLVLFGLSLRYREKGLAIACFPFLSPYVQPYSIPLALLGVAKDKFIFILGLIGLLLSLIDDSNVYIITRLIEPFIRN